MARFRYRMQNILDIKLKLEEQAKNEYAVEQRLLNEEIDKGEVLRKRLRDYEAENAKLKEGGISVRELIENENAKKIMGVLISDQDLVIKKQEAVVEEKRDRLTEVMQERKTHEKLKEKAFDQFLKDESAAESKTIDELTSYVFGQKPSS